jgi:dinuclear metal center YbgI/SA1388 family protein
LTEAEVAGVLLCLDVTEAIVDEAIASGCNLIVSHHPIIFKPIKRITGSNYIERLIIKALANGIAIYSAHTNIDNAPKGINFRLAQILGLENVRILAPKEDSLLKLAAYVPVSHADAVRDALFNAGCGHVGNYGSCSYNVAGFGTFKAGEGCNPFCGSIGEIHKEEEVRIETVLPSYLKNRVVSALLKVHPYEEPAYDIYPLKNIWSGAGAGVIGELPEERDAIEFMSGIKKKLGVGSLRYSPLPGKKIKKVALCSGAGGVFAGVAMAAGADLYLTGEARYHDLFNYPGMTVAVVGHYESEICVMDIFSEVLSGSFPELKIVKTGLNVNPVNYL